MTTSQEQAIIRHGQQLLAIFPRARYQDPVQLCKRLRRLEAQAHRTAEDFCNGLIDCDRWEYISDQIHADVCKLLGSPGDDHIMINGDARGYALKIDDEAMRLNNWQLHRDFGGYGIIAPEISR
jgi:hypothetical protein